VTAPFEPTVEVTVRGPRRGARIVGDVAHLELTKGAETTIDIEDVLLLTSMSWYISTNGYAVFAPRRPKPMVFLHRLVAQRSGICMSNLVDHIDGNRLNNRRANLRAATAHENARNERRVRPGKMSRFKGVYCHMGRWRALITAGGRQMCVGNFSSEVEAAAAYDAAADRLHGTFAATNRLLGIFTDDDIRALVAKGWGR
jgi:hypothetical protein